MKSNKGYILLECIVSMMIISSIVVASYCILSEKQDQILKNQENIDQIIALEDTMNLYKNKISNNMIDENLNKIEKVNGYEVQVNIKKDMNFIDTYLIDLSINNEKGDLNIKSYETK